MALHLSEKQRLLAGITAAVVLLVAFGFLIWRDRTKLAETRAAIASLKAKIEEYNKELRTRPQVEVQLIELERRHARNLRTLPESEELEQFYEVLEEARSQTKLRMSSVRSISGKGTGGGFRSTTWNISLQGPFFEIVKFINLLENHTRFVRIENWSFGSGGNSAELQVTTFFLPAAGKSEKPKSAAKPAQPAATTKAK